MDYFQRSSSGALLAEDVPLAEIANKVGTPFYVYSAKTLERHFDVFAQGFAGSDVLIAFAVKALSNIAVLNLLARRGAGADIVSGGEMIRALKAGVAAEKIVFSGVGKSAAEMADGLDAGIGQFNVESAEELAELNAIAESKGVQAPVALRINPDVDAGTLDKISTGRSDDKFGIPRERAEQIFAEAAALPGIKLRGLAMHIGSQITQLSPFQAAAREAVALLQSLRADGIELATLDLGGGLGIPYAQAGEVPPGPDQYARALREITDGLGVKIVLEPGRMIAGNAGLFVTSVVRTKMQTKKHFAIVDGAMNDLMRPALYGARHEIVPVQASEGEVTDYVVAGPVCESTDVFAEGESLPALAIGDLLAFRTAGAYGAVQASQYNTRPLVPEVLVRGDRMDVIRRRPSLEDILALESIPTS